MEKESDIDTKYHKLATEYSKVRSQATVLKKAVLDEQTRNIELNDIVKKHEQTMRKRDQEIESLVFRNEQLTKRIMVLQQDLQVNLNSKKSKNKLMDASPHNDMVILNEELQKKILENAQLYNIIAERDAEIIECNETNKNLDDRLSSLNKEWTYKERGHIQEKENYKKEINQLREILDELSVSSSNLENGKISDSDLKENVKLWKNEAERWKAECDFLRSKPDSNDKLTDYYEVQLRNILEKNVMLQSEIRTVCAENISFKTRLEHITLEHSKLKNNMETNYEELIITNKNYKSQLDAMTEHLAAQNEKIANQCDEIQVLKHKLLLKK